MSLQLRDNCLELFHANTDKALVSFTHATCGSPRAVMIHLSVLNSGLFLTPSVAIFVVVDRNYYV